MLCKGECGKEARFGKWCCVRYYSCEEYRKKLSDKAKLRGNNGVRGSLSKKSVCIPEGFTEGDRIEVKMVCDCANIHTKSYAYNTYIRGLISNKCKECTYKQISERNRTFHCFWNI